MVRSWLRGLLAVVVMIVLSACGGGSSLEGGSDGSAGRTDSGADAFLKSTQPRIAATSTMIADMARSIAGEGFTVYSILKPGTDPHVYEPTPGDSRVLSKADVILYNGFNLEPQLIKIIQATQNEAPKVAVAEVGGVKPYKLEKSAGIVVADPHAWGSAANGLLYVNAIEQTLARSYPDRATTFKRNADIYREDLTALGGWIGTQVATIPAESRKLVTSHDAFQYYGRAYGLTVSGSILGVSTEEEPSARKIAGLIAKIKADKVAAVFVETTTNPKFLQSVARDAGVKVGGTLYSDSLGVPGTPGDTYIKMLVANTRTIVETLGGSYTAFEAPSARAAVTP